MLHGISRPAWAIAPPATLFLVPALGLGADTGIVNFLLIALGYLGILVAEGVNTTARWTHGLARDSAQGFGEVAPVVWRATGYLAVPALLAAIVLGVALPTLSLSLSGIGFGTGGSGGPLQLTDPTLDLRRNLRQPADRVVIEYQTDAPDGVYLRMAALPKFSADGWTSVPIELSTGDQLSAVPGLSVTPGRQRRTDIRIRNFGSQYLPLPYAPRTVDVPGDWRYEPRSLVVLNADERPDDLRGLEYSVVSIDVKPSAADLADARVGTPVDAEVTTEIPDDLPPDFEELTNKVVADAETPAAKAAAIQAYLRGDEFTYSVEPQPGNGYRALQNFLFQDKLGYCEQFASSMALMARLTGIPTRVAVGFLPGEQIGDSWRGHCSEDACLARALLRGLGLGAVRTDPGRTNRSGATVDTAAGRGSIRRAERRAVRQCLVRSVGRHRPPGRPGRDPGDRREHHGVELGPDAAVVGWRSGPAPDPGRAGHHPRPPAKPAAERRGGRGGPGGERVGRDPRHGRGPRRLLAQRFTADDRSRDVQPLETEQALSMDRVATLVERARYAQTFTDTEAARQLPTVTQEIRRGIVARIGPLQRIRAVVLPRSLFPRRQRSR